MLPRSALSHAAPAAAYAPRTDEDRSARPGRGRRPAAGIGAGAAATARAGGGTTPCRLPGFSERPAASPCAAADWDAARPPPRIAGLARGEPAGLVAGLIQGLIAGGESQKIRRKRLILLDFASDMQ